MQLTDYGARLTALAGRPDTRADDLIKIAGELSRVQTQLELRTRNSADCERASIPSC